MMTTEYPDEDENEEEEEAENDSDGWGEGGIYNKMMREYDNVGRVNNKGACVTEDVSMEWGNGMHLPFSFEDGSGIAHRNATYFWSRNCGDSMLEECIRIARSLPGVRYHDG